MALKSSSNAMRKHFASNGILPYSKLLIQNSIITMKKLLLSAFAAVLALSAAAAPQVFDRRAALKAHAFDGKIEKQATASRFKAPAKKISTLADVPGNYVGYYASYFDDYAAAYCNVTIEQGSTDTDLIIKGLWGSWAKDLNATIDTETGVITIPRQSIYEYTGDTPADFVNVNDTTAAVTAQVYADGIVFNDPWGAKLNNANTYYVIGVSTILFEPNAKMTYTDNTEVNLYIEQSNDTVYIGNFADFGVDIHAVLAADSTFIIEPQLVSSSTNGDFYTTDLTTWYFGENQFQAFGNIPGKGTETTLTSALDGYGFTAGATTGYWYGQKTNFVITRLDEDVFVYPEAVAEPALYLIGSFNEWNEETQVPFVKDAAGNWTLTQEMAANAEFKMRDENGNWLGGITDGANFIVTQEQVANATALAISSPGMNFQIPVAGTWTLTVNPTDSTLIIAGEWVETVEPTTMYVLGEVNENSWAPNVGVEMVTEDNNVYTAEVNFDGRNEGYNYFSFTKVLAENADDWAAIAPYRIGAVSDGDFEVTDEYLNTELSLQAGEKAFKIPAGLYDLTLTKDAMTLVIAKVEPTLPVGDVTGDGKVDVADVNAVINIILKTKTQEDYPGNADVSGDDKVDVADVNAIINIILKTN